MDGKALMMTSYDTAFGKVDLSYETVIKFLVRGNGKVTEQEVKLFIEMCKGQKLNPYVTGEVHLIKYGESPAQLVVGYYTYIRRAEDNPNHLYNESGIVVQRGDEIVKKEGACLYPTEKLVGGWCRVHKKRGDTEVTTYKEVSFSEYDKKNAIWKEKPCMMIEKVAVSQCLREAYPKDYEGMYTPEEIAPAEYDFDDNTNYTSADTESKPEPEPDRPVTQKERQQLFGQAQHYFGVEEGNAMVKDLLEKYGIESTQGMMKSHFDEIMKSLKTIHEETTAEYQEVPYTEVE